MSSLTLELDDLLLQRLTTIAITQGKSSFDLATEAIARYLDDLRDIELATQAMEQLESGESYTLSLNELQERLDAMEHKN